MATVTPALIRTITICSSFYLGDNCKPPKAMVQHLNDFWHTISTLRRFRIS